MTGWALDLGTTNSALARWDEAKGQPALIELPAVCRLPDGDDPLEAPRMVPSALDLVAAPGWLDRVGAWPPLERLIFLGHRAVIGRQALERNLVTVHPTYVPEFKAALAGEALRPVARAGRRRITAREAAGAYLRELLVEARRVTGERARDLVVTAPVSAFETYRAEVQRLLGNVGVRRVRFIDEPVAAALGYGLSLSRERSVMVIDIGGGTMHVVLVRMTPAGAAGGEARVVAKQSRALGGRVVDGWVLEDACRQAGLPPLEDDGDEQTRFWRRLMLAEACRVKEAVHFDATAVFRVTPPGVSSRSASSAPGSSLVTLTRERLAELLEANGFYRGLEACLAAILDDAGRSADDVEDVLLVGGSTLLPGVYPLLERRFERRRLRAWQPFEAVAYGGACFAAERIGADDFIVHDYAFVTHDAATGAEQYTVIVPRGTRFPTPPEQWKRQLVPTCSLGEAESVFRLVICEVDRAGDGRRFARDAAGDLRKVGGSGGEEQVVVPLNAASPTLGLLDPPHQPGDRRPRLEITFAVNAQRWLVATVLDLRTRRELMHAEPVVRLI